jgi:malonyl-CoA O-methyltransferase
MTKAHKQRIAEAFSRSAHTYDQSAQTQDQVAAQVAALVLRANIHKNIQVLEIGCGTGALTRRLLAGIEGGSFFITDIATDMLAMCQRAHADPRARFACLDGEHLNLEGQTFDLIVSSLAVQWFGDLQAALERLALHLNPGGRLVFSTLGDKTFANWRAAHAHLGLRAGMSGFVAPTDLARMWPKTGRGEVTEWMLPRRYEDALAFARALKDIGAHTPVPDHQPLGAKDFRRVSAQLGADFTDSYHVVFGLFTKSVIKL